MVRIGVLSDTHGYWDDRYAKYFSQCDEIWHSGDIGSMEIIRRLQEIKPLRAVYGNIDGQDIRGICPKHQRFEIENVSVWMTHIGGYPGRYAPEVKPEIFRNPPRLFVSGHSHILKVMYDESLDLLYINPGAAGIYGAQCVRTILCFTIDGESFKDMEVIELNRN